MFSIFFCVRTKETQSNSSDFMQDSAQINFYRQWVFSTLPYKTFVGSFELPP